MVNLYAPDTLVFAVVDVPPLEDCRVCCPGVYLAVSHQFSMQGEFRGAEIYWSRDDTNWESLGSVDQESCLGYANTALGAPEDCNASFDLVNTVDVIVAGGVIPESVSEDEVLDGKNLALVGGEIISFQNVTPIDDTTFRLSKLLRGRHGTEAFLSTHGQGDVFVLLDPERLKFFEFRMGDIDTDRYFRAVPAGGVVDDAESQFRRVRAMNVRPIAPHLLTFERNNPSTNDVFITWRRRTRGNFRLFSSTNMRLCCCDSPNFELEIIDDGTGAVLRIVELENIEEFAYTAAMQTADGMTAGVTQFKVRIFQMSTSVGRGVGAPLMTVV